MLTTLLIVALVGYLLGAIPFGYLVARAYKVNIFEVGSKSPGATNVRRVLGKGPGNLVFTLDAIKGAVAASPWAACVLGSLPRSDGGNWFLQLQVLGLIAALVGHSFSCFTRFRGGKGVATGAGGLLVLMPVVVAIAVAAWIATFYSTGYVSLASIVSVLVLPVAAYFLHLPPLLIALAGLVTFFVILRHRANISRLCAGTENKFGKKPDQKKASEP